MKKMNQILMILLASIVTTQSAYAMRSQDKCYSGCYADKWDEQADCIEDMTSDNGDCNGNTNCRIRVQQRYQACERRTFNDWLACTSECN